MSDRVGKPLGVALASPDADYLPVPALSTKANQPQVESHAQTIHALLPYVGSYKLCEILGAIQTRA